MVRRWRRRSEVHGLRWWRRHKHNGAISGARKVGAALIGWPFAVVYWMKRRLRHLRSRITWYRTTRADIRRSRMQQSNQKATDPPATSAPSHSSPPQS
jgi:hypothetical protein